MTFANGDTKTMTSTISCPMPPLSPARSAPAAVAAVVGPITEARDSVPVLSVAWSRNRSYAASHSRSQPFVRSSSASAVDVVTAKRIIGTQESLRELVPLWFPTNSTASAPVDSLVSAIVSWTHRRRALVVVAVLCATLVSLAGVRRLSFDTDVLSLLPHDGRVIQSFRTFLSRFGSLDQLYVVFTAPEGHTSPNTPTRSTPGSSGCGRRPRSPASTPASSIARAISAGSPTASCSCSASAPLDEALRRLRPGRDARRRRGPARAAGRAVVRRGRARSAGSARPVRVAARRARRHAGRPEPRRQRGGIRDRRRPQPSRDRAAAPAAVRRGVLARARRAAARDRRVDPQPRRHAARHEPTTSRCRRCRSSSPAVTALPSKPKPSCAARASSTRSARSR